MAARRRRLKQLAIKHASQLGKPRQRKHAFRKTATILAPKCFSAIQNPNTFLIFLHRIATLGRTQNLYFDFSGITSLAPDGIAAFLAAIHDRRISGAEISGNVPTTGPLQSILRQSGFYEYVKTTRRETAIPALGKIRKRHGSGEVIDQKFNQFVANDLISFATNCLRGKEGAHRPTYCVLGEAMLNTVHHASPQLGEPQPWWASVYYDPERKRACFTFIDQGVGIFKSNQLSLRLKLVKGLVWSNRGEILKELMNGNIPSSTKDPGRGNGIPNMHRHCKAGRIRRFTVLSNDALGDSEGDVYEQLASDFAGTLLYWEIEE